MEYSKRSTVVDRLPTRFRKRTIMIIWNKRLNNATDRRLEKLEKDGIEVDTSTHQGRALIGYNYLDYEIIPDD